MQRTKNSTPINDYGLPNIVIPAEVIFNENLTWTERALFGFVQNLTRNEYGFAWVSNRMLGRHIGCNPKTVSTMLSKLHKEGYLILEYEITWDGENVRKIYLDLCYKNGKEFQ